MKICAGPHTREDHKSQPLSIQLTEHRSVGSVCLTFLFYSSLVHFCCLLLVETAICLLLLSLHLVNYRPARALVTSTGMIVCDVVCACRQPAKMLIVYNWMEQYNTLDAYGTQAASSTLCNYNRSIDHSCTRCTVWLLLFCAPNPIELYCVWFLAVIQCTSLRYVWRMKTINITVPRATKARLTNNHWFHLGCSFTMRSSPLTMSTFDYCYSSRSHCALLPLFAFGFQLCVFFLFLLFEQMICIWVCSMRVSFFLGFRFLLIPLILIAVHCLLMISAFRDLDVRLDFQYELFRCAFNVSQDDF